MIDKTFRILSSIFIAFIAGLIALVPSLYIVFEISNLSKDSSHPVMATGPVFGAILIAIIIFILVFYLALKKIKKLFPGSGTEYIKEVNNF